MALWKVELLLEISSIYKPYWIGNYKGKEIFVDA